MFVHCVYFWLKADLSDEHVAHFTRELRSLIGIASVRNGFFGVPAATNRSIIDRSYSYALVCTFDDEAGHDAYQVDPVHDRFREECGSFWEQVKIYDFVQE